MSGVPPLTVVPPRMCPWRLRVSVPLPVSISPPGPERLPEGSWRNHCVLTVALPPLPVRVMARIVTVDGLVTWSVPPPKLNAAAPLPW